ncbi:acetate kinase [Microcella daejeonensis]|uniref:acetate/propionate family kinase n=1 Tax=Microcella daejeonensis TaxID=2994971 RepID=UPI00226FDFAE|nr:acetate kinase [Microcella daejeonensis]WAB84170.1 acetate kinase [Microcella daejeonensis]
MSGTPGTRVFVVNSGSSSIKYQLVDVETEQAILSGLVERIGEPGGGAVDHVDGMRRVLAELGDAATDLTAVGHRVVHGGSVFTAPTAVTEAVIAQIEQVSTLAPLHNPANLAGIRAAMAVLPGVPHVAVFDTAFHQSMSPAAYTYAIDRELARSHGVRRYGFHGTSHAFVAEHAAAHLGRSLEQLKLIVLHLGNGASIAAIDAGRSIDTSMGLTPLQGLVMGTRSGDLDPAVLLHLHRQAGLSVDELDTLLNKQSGLLGLSGSADMRDVTRAADEGDADAALALDVWAHRIRHYVGAYLAQLGGLDAVVFTAGVGENSAPLRSRALAGLEHLGVHVDPERNGAKDRSARTISPEGASVAVLVVPTNEELSIARQAAALAAGEGR